MSETEVPSSAQRRLTRSEFDRAYLEVIQSNHFCEEPRYYGVYKDRYWSTLRLISELPLPRPARILEVGGGQMLLLSKRLFDDCGMVVDISSKYAEGILKYGLGFAECDLLHDDLPERGSFDLIIMCEVIEHLPVPPHKILQKMRTWIKPGGYLLITTPNLYRPRNAVRLLLGRNLFCHFRYPEKGHGLGHPLEYDAEHLKWQVEQGGFENVVVELRTLSWAASTLTARVGRLMLAPLALRPLWRESLVAMGRKPFADGIQ